MSTMVKIIYNGPVVEQEREAMQIARYFAPNNSYVDSDVYQGFDNAAAVGDEGTYGKSIYATNVEGWDKLPGLLPMASTPTRLAQYQRAIKAAIDAAENGEENTGIEFDIGTEIGDDYKEAIFWHQVAPHMVEYGFYTLVGDTAYGVAPAASEGGEGGEGGGSGE